MHFGKFDLRKRTLSGSPAEIGLAHGKGERALIQELAQDRLRLSSIFPAATGKPRLLNEMRDLVRRSLPSHETFSPSLMEEFRAVAEGAGIDPVDLLLLNGYTDFKDLFYAELPVEEDGGCTAFLIDNESAADGRGLIGQTWDMDQTAPPFVVLLEILPDNAPGLLTFTIAGCLGMVGMNEHGLAVGINNLHVRHGRVGVTWPFVIREILRHRTAAEALEVLARAPLAGAHNYLVMDAEGQGWNCEALPGRQVVTKTPAIFAHTNHCLHPEFAGMERERTPHQEGSTCNRLEQATRFLGNNDGRITPESLMALTRLDEPGQISVCMRPIPGEYEAQTAGACLMRPSTREMWVLQGLPSANEYTRMEIPVTATRSFNSR